MVRGEVEKKVVEGGEVEICVVEIGRNVWKLEETQEGGKEIKEKKNGKEIIMRRYFLGRDDDNNGSGGFPGLSRGCGNLSGKYRNRPEIKYLGTTRNNYQKSIIIYED